MHFPAGVDRSDDQSTGSKGAIYAQGEFGFNSY